MGFILRSVQVRVAIAWCDTPFAGEIGLQSSGPTTRLTDRLDPQLYVASASR